ncbi:putative ester cyclase [Nocardia tenerifensis]|uniref:Putative ester cyclase n=1 Tax=Nocardia tenerifensis TaxID=228006 RepID=A0A318KFD5_9NOCA|nr:ester cyclase family protein [Nocardia tenerifensis]PXX71549.1 putative ester cyclase [Nocardia tenerifensis]
MSEARELTDAVWLAIEHDEFDELERLFAPDAIVSTSAGSGRGREYAGQLFARHKSGYPDLRRTVLDAVESADGASVALRNEFVATHLGELRGPFGTVAPTGRRLCWQSSDHVRCADGLIVEWHAHFDRLTVLQQLGLSAPNATDGAVGKRTVTAVLREVFEQGRVERLDELLSPGFVNHRVPPGLDNGIESVKHVVALERAAFPDLAYTIEHAVAEGDMVIVVTLAEGTHRGVIFGVAPTGQRVAWRQVHIARMEGERMAEHWGVSDLAALWVQLGRAEPIGAVR